MPAFLEKRLKAEASKKGFSGKRADRYIYGTLQNIGALHGSVETQKGKAMTAKHNRDVKAGKANGDSGHPGRNLKHYLHPKGGL